ncbi:MULTISPECIES: pseudouridine synthase [unclassified Neptuniibacter]|uniref:pseudouridine synthase n=1 Tax=unclassified Neptuniibacter TaxID=2630693 RepID=UPI000C687DC2|nr:MULTISPECIES: pseudouridine synthase [unclassified Neptuniibacter]MAY42544.1 16S rRNA pseudouridine(516) synthase [Oceanospirillaceae bacterium]|tara:strand:+ start:3083 stop:3778 length:696 start_codon:yes stop_codon:yes gene_type:complete
MRLDKYLSQSTDYSRKEVRRFLKMGEVTLNGEEVRDPSMHVNEVEDEIYLNGYPLEAPGEKYLMLNKPLGCVCSNNDGTHPSVLSFIDLPRANELVICGRLDVDTTGLVLITTDGKWAHRITSPKHKTGKLYQVVTADPIPEDAVDKFAQGMMLINDKVRTKPAELRITASNEAEVILTEGRYHQVKRMFGAIGNKVEELHRASIGNIHLDEDLELGEYRFLTDQEINSIQ